MQELKYKKHHFSFQNHGGGVLPERFGGKPCQTYNWSVSVCSGHS